MLSPSGEESINEMQETDDVLQEILTDSDELYATSKSSTSKQFSQLELNELVRYCGFSKNAAEYFCF